MNIDNIKSYVYYYSENNISLRSLKYMRTFFSFFTFFSLVIGFADRNLLLYSIATLLLTALYAGSVFAFQKFNKKATFSLRFLVNGLFSVFSSVFFLVLAYQIMAIEESATIIYKLSIPFCMFVFAIVFNVNIALCAKNGKFASKHRASKSMISLWASCGAVLGVFLARALSTSFNNHTAIDITVFCFSMISLMFLLGTHNFLKLYWCKKYAITNNEQGVDTTDNLCYNETKRSNAKKLLHVVLYVMCALLILFSLIGVYVTTSV